MTRAAAIALLLSTASATALSASTSLPAEQGPPPAPHCFSAREVREVRQSDPQTLAVRLTDGARYRVELADVCPGAMRADHPRLVSRQGWICGSNEEILDLGERRCAVAGLARIDAREYAEHALRSDRGGGDIVARGALDTIVVRGKRRRGFGGSTAYCLDARYMRAWSEDAGDLVVEVSPMRSGGNRYYRVELGSGCAELSSAIHVQLVSAVGTTAICGNIGDRAVFLRDENVGGVERPRTEGSLAAQYGCTVKQVYPLSPGEGSGKR